MCIIPTQGQHWANSVESNSAVGISYISMMCDIRRRNFVSSPIFHHLICNVLLKLRPWHVQKSFEVVHSIEVFKKTTIKHNVLIFRLLMFLTKPATQIIKLPLHNQIL